MASAHFNQAGNSSYTDLNYKVFQVDKGWGYDIMNKDILLIHQPFIPGISGVHPFETRAEGEKVASLAIMKIKSGIFPPTITQSELDSIKKIIK